MSGKPSYTVVVTSDRYELDWEAKTLAELQDMDVTLRAGTVNSEDDMIELARGADVLLVSSREPVTRRVIENIPGVKLICRYSVGYDLIDIDAATEHGIIVSHCPDYCTSEVADHAFALLLSLNRRIVEINEDLHKGAWNEKAHFTRQILRGPIPPLREQTLGIVGIGRIGRMVAERAKPFGLRILAADPHISAEEIEARGAEPVSLDELLRQSDLITLHTPLNDETRGLIGERELSLVKPSAMLVNTSRGPVIDLTALAAALQEGRLNAAALDVVYPEPLPADSILYQLPNVILTPHAAYYSERSIKQVRIDTLDAGLRVLRGQLPRTVVNPGVLPKVDLSAYTRA
jgi:D-3-phosphoglycerate dehydrogenase